MIWPAVIYRPQVRAEPSYDPSFYGARGPCEGTGTTRWDKPRIGGEDEWSSRDGTREVRNCPSRRPEITHQWNGWVVEKEDSLYACSKRINCIKVDEQEEK